MSSDLVQPVILTQKNLKAGTNNTFELIPATVFYANDIELSVKSIYIYFSWFNITAKFQNQSISYIFNGVTRNLTIPPGLYASEDIAGYINFIQEQNGEYLVDNNGTHQYFISLNGNSISYSITMTLTPIPSVLPTGWTNPKNITLSGLTPQIIIPPNGTSSNGPTGMGVLLGFNAGTYPTAPSSTLYSNNSQNTPILNPVTSVNLNCNLINNIDWNANSPNVVATFSKGDTAFGGQIKYEPTYPIYYKIGNGRYPKISVWFTDNNGNNLDIVDTNITITLFLKSSNKIA